MVGEIEQAEGVEQLTNAQAFDWNKFFLGLVSKHPREIRDLLSDLDPATRTMLMGMLEAKYPKYMPVVNMVMGDGGREQDDGNDEYEDEEKGEKEQRPPTSSIIMQAIDDVVTMRESGMNMKTISDQIYHTYGIDWNVQELYHMYNRRLAYKTPGATQEPPKAEQLQPVGIIRRFLRWVW